MRMVTATFHGDPIDLDAPLNELAAAFPDRPIRLWIQPNFVWPKPGQRPVHRGWSGVSWSLQCPTVADAIALRQALEAFFVGVTEFGAEALMTAIRQALTAAQPRK